MDYVLNALGFKPKPILGPLKVFQGERFVGTVPCFPVVSTSFIFDVRPGDFKPVERDGETVLEAAPMICPGDFECLAGFEDAQGRKTEKGEAAAMFDALVAAAGKPRNA